MCAIRRLSSRVTQSYFKEPTRTYSALVFCFQDLKKIIKFDLQAGVVAQW